MASAGGARGERSEPSMGPLAAGCWLLIMAGYGAREASGASRASACCLLPPGGCMWLYVAVCGSMWLYVALCGYGADNGWIWGARGERSEPSICLLPAGGWGLYVALCGCMWLYVAVCGSMWIWSG